jgi:hypothetical protein
MAGGKGLLMAETAWEKAERRRRLAEIQEWDRRERAKLADRIRRQAQLEQIKRDMVLASLAADYHAKTGRMWPSTPKPKPLPPKPATTTRVSTGRPWGVRVMYRDGTFEWTHVANEAEGRRVAKTLAGRGGTVDVLQMGGRGRIRNAAIVIDGANLR